jgi:hypothetical protein
MRIVFALALAAASLPASAAQYYSTTGMIANLRYDAGLNKAVYDSFLPEMNRYGIAPTLVVATDGPDASPPAQPFHGYQLLAMAMNDLLNEAQARTGQRKIAIDLFNVFFRGNAYPNGVPCLGYQAAFGMPDPNVNFRADLRADYQARMTDFKNRLPAGVTAANFEFISVNPESGCVPAADINLAAAAVKAAIPTVKVAAGYEISVDARPEEHIANGVNHIGKFASGIDRIITWSYGVMNPANDNDPQNARSMTWPNSTFSRNYGVLKSKLRTWQTIDFVVDGHYINQRHGQPLHWLLGRDHARLAANWCNWLRNEPLVSGALVFTYGASSADYEFESFAEMPQLVRDTHANFSAGVCAVPDTLLAADAFTMSPAGTALPNASLHNRVTEAGGTSWIASNAIIRFAGTRGTLVGEPYGGGYAGGMTGTNPMAVVPVVGAANRPLTVTADINPQNSEWTAIGLSGFANHGWFGDGQLWVYLKNSGRYNVLANGTAISLTGGERFDARIKPNALNRVELFYDKVARTVALRINGYVMLPATVLPVGYTPVTSYAGWSALAVAGNGPAVDSFELRRR